MLNNIKTRRLIVAVITAQSPFFLLNTTNAIADDRIQSGDLSKTTSEEQATKSKFEPLATESSSTDEKKTPAVSTPEDSSKSETTTAEIIDELLKDADAAVASGKFAAAEEYYLDADTKLPQAERNSIKAFDIQNDLADLYNKQDRLKDAITTLTKALRTLQSLPEEEADGALRTKTQFKLASAFMRAGIPKRAILESKTALAMFDKYSLDDPLMRARILGILGASQYSTGFFKEAEATFEQALQIVSPLCPPPNSTAEATADQKKALITKGQILCSKASWKTLLPGKEIQADSINDEAFKCLQRGYGSAKGDSVYFEMSFKQEPLVKEAYLKKAQEILDTANKEYGPESLEALVGLKELAQAQFGENKFSQSIATCEKGIKLCSKLLPAESAKASVLWTAMAFANLRLGDKLKAASCFRKTYENSVSNAGDNSLDVACAAENLAMAYALNLQVDEAEQLYLKAWKINEGLLGRNNKAVLQNLSNLGAIYTVKGKMKEATQYTYWAYVLTRQLYGSDSPSLSLVSGNLAMLYLRSGNTKEADTLIKQHLALEAKLRGTQRPEYADALMKEAQIRLVEGKVDLATANMGKAFQIKEKALGLTNKETYEVMSTYYDFLRRLGKTQQANAIQARYKLALAKKK